ncbi:MAG: LytTR family transcriptional regulator DNA-binding domain-containing protein [Bacteroidota bacterium]
MPLTRYAILPFANHAGGDQEYFVRGLMDLAYDWFLDHPGLVIVARESVERLPATRPPKATIFRQLGVDRLLTANLRRKGGNFRLDLSCFEADDELPVWHQRLRQPITAASTLSLQLVEVLRQNIAPAAAPNTERSEPPQHKKRQPLNQRALRAFLLGNHYLHRWEHGYAELALEQFDVVAALEPDFVPARLGRVKAITFLVGRGFRRAEIEYPRALNLLDNTIALAPTYGDLYIARGIIEFFYLLDWDSAYRNIERGLQNLSEASEAYAQLSLFWYGMREYDRSLEALQAATEYNPLSISLLQMRGDVLLSAERFAEATEVFKSILELQPGDKPALENLMYLAALQRNRRRCRYYLRQLLQDVPSATAPVTYPRLGYVYAWLGMEAETQATLSTLERLAREDTRNVQYGRLANVYSGMGDHDRAMDYAEQTFAHRTGILFVLTDPQFKPLRQRPRYRQLEQRIKLSPNLTSSKRIRIQSQLKAFVDVALENLLYARAEQNYLTLVIHNNFRQEERLLRMSMKSLVEQLPQDRFWRCHKSWLVNRQLEYKVSGNTRKRQLTSVRFGFTVPVGRGKQPAEELSLVPAE